MKGTDISGAKLVTVEEDETYTLEEDSFVWFSHMAGATQDTTYYTIIDGVTLNNDFQYHNASIFSKGITFKCPERSGIGSMSINLFVYPLTKQGGVRVSSYHIVSFKSKSKEKNLCH